MFNFERRQRASFVAAEAGEGHDRATSAPLARALRLPRGAESLFLNPHDRKGAQASSPSHGRKKAISAHSRWSHHV